MRRAGFDEFLGEKVKGVGVQGGREGASLNTRYWPKGGVKVEVQFPMAPRPLAIRARYGDFGEELTGNNVAVLGASKVVTAEHAFDWTR